MQSPSIRRDRRPPARPRQRLPRLQRPGLQRPGPQQPGQRRPGLRRLREAPHPLPRPLLTALHLAREIAYSLLSRPLSFGNAVYVRDATDNLGALARALGAIPWNNPRHRRRTLYLLDQCGQGLDRQRLEALVDWIDTLDPLYHYARTPFAEMPPGVLEGRHYEHLIVMIGPGIGLGDEIGFRKFLATLRQQSPKARMHIYTFFRTLWPTLSDPVETHDLVGCPLAAFEHLEQNLKRGAKDGRTLAIFGNFAGQKMLAPFLHPRTSLDVLEIALGHGEARWLPADGTQPVEHRIWTRGCPNQHRALERLTSYLVGRSAVRRRVEPPKPLSALGRGSTLRLVVNPMTSKDIVVKPEDWARLIAAASRQLRVGDRLEGLIYPGLSPRSERFADEIVERYQKHRPRAGDRLRRLTGPGNHPFSAENGIRATYEAISQSHLLLGMDTFSAHLAGQTDTPSLAICLWRNPQFWHPSTNTLWADVNVGFGPLETLAEWMTQRLRGADLLPGIDPRVCRRVLELGSPSRLALAGAEAMPRRSRDLWRSHLDPIWAALPEDRRRALQAIDHDYAWPQISAVLAQGGATARWGPCMGRLADSMFYRMIALGARPGPQRPRPQTTRQPTRRRAVATGRVHR